MIQKKPKNKPCWYCDQVGHWVNECPLKKAKTSGATDAALVNIVTSTLSNSNRYLTIKLKLFTIHESYDCIVDIEANVHICADKSLFVSY